MSFRRISILLLVFSVSFVFAGQWHQKAAEPLPREALVKGLEAYWGQGPQESDIVDPDMQIIEKVELEDHYRWHVSYMVEKDDKSYAYILFPKPMPTKEKPLPLVLCPHSTTGEGKKAVAGLSSRDEEYKRQRQHALDLVRLGFITFAPDMAGYGERVLIDKPATRYNFEHVADFKQKWLKKWPNARFPHGKQIWDIKRALDMLVEFDNVDSDNIGIIGHSLGAWTVMNTMPMDTRIKAGVANAGGTLRFIPYIWEEQKRLVQFLKADNAKNMHNMFNVGLMAAAPRSILHIKAANDSEDYAEKWTNQLEGFRVINDYFKQKGGGSFAVLQQNCGHTFKRDSRFFAYAWLHKHLFEDRNGAVHSAITPVPQNNPKRDWWMPRHQDIVERVKNGNVDLIMIGDSITHRWDSTGKAVWDEYYSSRNAVNMGFGGDRTQHVLWRLENGEIDGINPKLAVVMIGTNNTNLRNGNTTEEIADGIIAICKRLRSKLPETKVLLLSIFPRDEKPSYKRNLNATASKIASEIADGKWIYYLNINHKFLDENEILSKDIMPDLIHPNEKGYQIWAEAMEPTIKKLMGE
ncbi:putative dienelactone hydrolase [Limihaloglobus sulfuriphilus]|uniref:Putative dienelactone hydrolase n=1 Tax=Limihaloglobus sulfuriphilus TaxID=1851148 RepID=A0A1Q2MCT1_9BACT|nr:platelet-activating factor acetylhydrolase IB subunit [Limihaloglobus sulfuriphilus]AQQ70501.1 putative dienelactone hydrolase [Limihaloglobus sulfuriphilus]